MVNILKTYYDDDGNPVHYVNDEEVPKDVWERMHPFIQTKGVGNGGDSLGGRPGFGGDAGSPEAEEVREGLRAIRAENKRSGSAADELG